MLVATCYNLGGEKTLMRLDEGSIVARAAGRQLESLNGKREILVVGVVHQEPVVERFLRERKRIFSNMKIALCLKYIRGEKRIFNMKIA